MLRPKILIWHIHGSYLNYIVHAAADFYLPVRPDRSNGYGGKGRTFLWPDNVHEVPAEEVRNTELDLVIHQAPRNYFEDGPAILSDAQRRLPQIYIEHDTPREHPTHQRHFVADEPGVLLVHVTHFNRLMWDSGRCPTVVVEHGVPLEWGARYVGRLERGIVALNHPDRRGRVAGWDVLRYMRARVPLDLAGMGTETLGGLGDIPHVDLARAEARYRFFFNPTRYTSLPLALLEAMAIGLPAVALATTEVPTVIEDGRCGYVSCDLDYLEDRMKALLRDRPLADALGRRAREVIAERFSIDRFARDWERVFEMALDARHAEAGASRRGQVTDAPDAWAGMPGPVGRRRVRRRAAGDEPPPDGATPLSRGARAHIAMLSEHASPLARGGGEDTGGQNVFVDQIARSLAELGFAVDVFTRRDRPDLPDEVRLAPGARVVHLKAGPAEFVKKDPMWAFMPEFRDAFVRYARSRAPEERYALIHAHFWMSGWVACQAKATLDVPVVETFHALGIVKRLHQGPADTSPPDRIAVERGIFDEADLILAECPQDLTDMVELYGADRSRIEVVPAGVNPIAFHPVPRRVARAHLGLDRDAWTVVYVGRMVRRKGIDNLVEAFARLARRQEVPVRLVIVGGETSDSDPMQTPEIRRLAEIAEREGVRGLVRFTGRVQQEDLKHYYSAADVAVTTPWYEPFGMTPLEAMACGTPVIGSGVGGIKYTVVDGETGFLVPPRDPEALADRMQRFVRDRALARRMGIAARARVEECFTWEKIAASVAGHYERLISAQTAVTGRRAA